MVKFSFIIPTKNEGKYIENCLKSIESQTLKNYEIIVVDSFSEDGTVEIAKKYSKILEERKKGPSAAKNKGAKIAKGDILIFMDADVRIRNNFLSEIENLKTGAVFELEFWDYMEYQKYCKPFNNVIRFLFKIGKPTISSSLIVCNKEIFNNVKGFREDLLTCEDVDLIKKIAKKSEFHFYSSKIKISARRLKKLGILKYLIEHSKNILLYNIFNKSNSNYWN